MKERIMGTIKTSLLMVGLIWLFMYIGHLINGQEGMTSAFYMACCMNFISYFFSDTIVLKQYRAKEVKEKQSPELYHSVEWLASKTGLPMPKVYIIPEQVPNAFATGRNPKHSAVAVTEGLLKILNKEEIEAVLAHEMSHVKHHDILIGTIAAVFAGSINLLGNFIRYNPRMQQNSNHRNGNILVMIVAPIAALIIQMTISRTREYDADRGAAELTDHPEWLISALEKIDDYAHHCQMQRATTQTAHMFIISPFSGLKNSLSTLFSTHPSTANRIERLRQLMR